MDLRNKLPGDTYQFLVTTDRTNLYDGSGSLLTNLNVTNITSSQVTESIILTTQITASSVLIGIASASIIFSTTISASSVTSSNIVSKFGDTMTGNLTAPSFTGSLLGTSSNAISSSYAFTSSYIVGNTNAFIQGGNSFGQSASLGTNDQNILVLRSAGMESIYISSSLSNSLQVVGVSINVAPVDGFPLSIGGAGQIQLTGSSPRIVSANNSGSLKVTGGGPGIGVGSRWELYGEGTDTGSIGGGQLQGGVYFSTKRSGSFIVQLAPNVGNLNGLSTMFLVNPAGNAFNGTGTCGVFNSAPTASLDVTGDIRVSTNITASNISASNRIQAISFTGSLLGTSSYALTSSNGTVAWGYLAFNGTTLTSNTYNATVTRGAAGSYNVLFQRSLPSSQYAVLANAHSGSDDTSATGSIAWARSQTTTGFTMSCQLVTALTVLTDFTTASFSVFSY